MSREGRDKEYKPTKKPEQTETTSTRQSSHRPTRKIDYKEVEVIISGGESDETVVSESGFEGSIKLEGEESKGLPRDSLWTRGTRTETVTAQWNRLSRTSSELAMAREAEQSRIEKLMELMLQMQMQEKERVAQREQEDRRREDDRLDRKDRLRREQTEKEEKREEERERRQERLLQTLRGAQPAVPHKK